MTNNKSQPIFSVVVPTVGREENVNILLKSLLKQSLKSFEVILVFRNVTSQTRKKYVSKFKLLNLVIIVQKGSGLVSARNTGLYASRGKFVVFTDDDVEPTKRWLQELRKSFGRDRNIVGATGPSIIPDEYLKNRDLTKFTDTLSNGNILCRTIGKFYFWYFYENQQFSIGKWFKSGAFSLGANYPENISFKNDIEVMDLQACNFAVRKENAVACKGFDDSFQALASYSESDFAFRLKTGHLKLVFNPKAAVYHKPSQGGVFKERIKSKSEIENYLLFYFRHIKIINLENLFRFVFYFLIVSVYRGLYQSIKSLSISPLLGVLSGTVSGFKKVITQKIYPTNISIRNIKQKLNKYFHHPSVILWRSLELEAVTDNLPKIQQLHPMLDLGCGEGKVAEIIFGKKTIDVGLDPEPEMIKKAKIYGVYKKVVQGDARKMPFESESFNFVFSNSVIEHIDGIDQVVMDVSRIMKPGGCFMLTVPNNKLRENLLFTRLFKFLGLRAVGKKYSKAINRQLEHFNLFSTNKWSKLLSKNKLEIIYSGYYLDEKQTIIWDLYRVIFFILKPFENRSVIIKAQDMISSSLLKRAKDWQCPENEGSCTIIIAKKN